MYKKFLFFIAIVISSVVASAQELIIQTEQNDMLEDNSIACEVDFTQAVGDSIVNATLTYYVNGTGKEIVTSVTNGILTIPSKTIEIASSAKEGKYEIFFELNYSVAKDANETEKKGIKSNTITVNVWKHANVSLSGPQNAIVGTDCVVELSKMGGKPDGWGKTVWKVDGKEISSTSDVKLTYKVPLELAGKSMTVEATTLCTTGKVTETPNATASLQVYAKPEVANPVTTEYEPYYSGDGTITLNFKHEGGCTAITSENVKQGWEFEWFTGSSSSNCNNALTITTDSKLDIKDNVSEEKNEYYKVVCHNWVDGKDYFANDKKEFVFHTHIYAYPAIDSNVTLGVFFGEESEIELETKSGYTSGWTFEWKHDDVVLSKGKRCTIPAISIGDKEKEEISGYTVSAWNHKKDGTLWKEFLNVPVKITAYALPGVEKMDFECDRYYDPEISLSVRQIAGIEGQWRHNWYYKFEGETGDSHIAMSDIKDNISYSSLIQYYTTNREDVCRVLHVTDTCINGYAYNQKTFVVEYDIRVWPKAKFAEKMDAGSLKVRDGNSYEVSLMPSTGGYYAENTNNTSKNTYTLSLGNRSDGLSDSEENRFSFDGIDGGFIYNGKGKETASQIIRGRVNVLGPNGEIWDSKDYEDVLVIYKRPLDPKQLVKKGNGKSGTVIAMIDVSENDLQRDGYEFLFGSGDQVLTSSVDRYAVIGDSYFAGAGDLWTATIWKYDDGMSVAGYRRYLDGHYDNGSDDSNALNSRAEDSDGIVNVTTSEGDNAVYDARGLRSAVAVKGLNLVRMNDGSIRKVMVK